MQNFSRAHIQAPARQRGVIVFIALIVLVAMTLVAIGTMRSVDTSNVVSGNLAFKQATLSATDQGIEAAYRWLITNAGSTVLNNDNSTLGYFSSAPAANNEPDWTNLNDPVWQQAACAVPGCTSDGSGNTATYVIQRMCTEPNTTYNGTGATSQPNTCATLSGSSGGETGSSHQVGASQFSSTPQIYYRITARVVGPRNAVSVVQTMVAI